MCEKIVKIRVCKKSNGKIKEDEKWTFFNGEGKKWDADNEDVECELFLYQQADPGINSSL